MPKIRYAEFEVPNGEHCDKPTNVCPMCRSDGVIDFCLLFSYALEEDPDNGYLLKKLKICKESEVKE